MSAFWPDGSRTAKPRRTREFGYRSTIYKRGYHTGWDTAGYDLNHAAEGGVVERCYYDGSYGNTVLVRHADGSLERTAHGAPGGFRVSPGQRVDGGQVLLVQGTTGMSTGKHNHQEIILPDGTFVDPETWIANRGAAPAGTPASGGSAPLGWFDTPTGDEQFYYWHYGNALRGDHAPNQWLRGGQSLKVVENPGTGPVKVECADGDHVWVGTRNHPARVRGAGGAPAPAEKRRWVDLGSGWVTYGTLDQARRASHEDRKTIGGQHVITGGDGPYKIFIGTGNGNGYERYVGSKTLPPVFWR